MNNITVTYCTFMPCHDKAEILLKLALSTNKSINPYNHAMPQYSLNTQGLAVIFSHRQVYVKREGRTLFLMPKVKVEFQHLFSLQKRFSPSGLDNFLAYSIPVSTDLIILIEIKISKYNFLK
jgi:hypothetical protein